MYDNNAKRDDGVKKTSGRRISRYYNNDNNDMVLACGCV